MRALNTQPMEPYSPNNGVANNVIATLFYRQPQDYLVLETMPNARADLAPAVVFASLFIESLAVVVKSI